MKHYIDSVRRKCGFSGVHIVAMKIMRYGRNQEALMRLEPAICKNDFALMLYIDLIFFGRIGITRDIGRCEHLLFQRIGIDTDTNMTKLLELHQNATICPNIWGLLLLIRISKPIISVTNVRTDFDTINANLFLWSEGSLYGTLAQLCLRLYEIETYEKLVEEKDKSVFKTLITNTRGYESTQKRVDRLENHIRLYNHPAVLMMLSLEIFRISNPYADVDFSYSFHELEDGISSQGMSYEGVNGNYIWPRHQCSTYPF